MFTEAAIYADPINPVPIYVPVMISCLLPVIFSNFGMFSKYVFIYKKISPQDFTFGYFLIARGMFFLVSLYYFQFNEMHTFEYFLGFIGSMLDLTGCFFANSAVSTGNPCGPIFALCDSQILIVTVIVTVFVGIVPHWMQALGLLSGFSGALVLALYEYYVEYHKK